MRSLTDCDIDRDVLPVYNQGAFTVNIYTFFFNLVCAEIYGFNMTFRVRSSVRRLMGD